MKPWQTLPGLLKLAVTVEISTFLLGFLADSQSLVESDGSTFEHFWNGLWYPLAGVWALGWIAVLKNWNKSFEIYAAGTIAAITYSLLSGPTAYSSWADSLGGVSSIACGAVFILAWIRKSSIGDWSQPIEELPAFPVEEGSGTR